MIFPCKIKDSNGEFEIVDLWRDEDNNICVKTTEGKVLVYTNPVVTNHTFTLAPACESVIVEKMDFVGTTKLHNDNKVPFSDF